MDAMKFKGTLVYIGEVTKFTSPKTGKEFVKRDIAIADDPNEQYPTVLVATLKKTAKADNTALVKAEDLNRECELEFFPDGRFYTDKTGARRAMAGNTAWKLTFTTEMVSVTGSEPEPTDAACDDMPF